MWLCAVRLHVLLQLKAGVWGFDDFLRNGLVEYLDVNEEDNALIALYEENIGDPWHALLTLRRFSICYFSLSMASMPCDDESQ